MFKKIIFLLISLFIVACSSTKPTIRTTKSVPKKYTTVQKASVKNTTPSKETTNKQSQTLEATSNVKVTTEVVLKYIEDYKEIAKENMRQHGIPASITLAQGILESGAGLGRLSQQANNHFGIKCHKEWKGPSVSHDDDAEQECFRKYHHASESFRDHSLFLTSRSRYASLFSLPEGDYVAWAKGLKEAGYATDPKYPDKLIGLINRYNLHQYDNEVIGKTNQNERKQVDFVSNEKSYTVMKGDTLYSLSRKFNLSVDEIRKKNNLKTDTLSIGQQLILK
jgi:flagellum-specific peptidoglycan hydrolase FlgJ